MLYIAASQLSMHVENVNVNSCVNVCSLNPDEKKNLKGTKTVWMRGRKEKWESHCDLAEQLISSDYFQALTSAEAARKGQEKMAVANEDRGGQQPASAYATVQMNSKHSEV